MTIKENPIRLTNDKLTLPDRKSALKSSMGLTKEQILLKDLKIIAKEYLELEKLKKTFSKIILKNLDELDFSQFIKFPRFYIKEKFIKKSLLVIRNFISQIVTIIIFEFKRFKCRKR